MVEKTFRYTEVFEEDKQQNPVWKNLSEKRMAFYSELEIFIKYVTKKDYLENFLVEEFWWEKLTEKCLDSFRHTDWNEIEFCLVSFKENRNDKISSIFSPDLKFFEASNFNQSQLVFTKHDTKNLEDFIFDFKKLRYIFIFIKIQELENLVDYSMRPMFAISFSP
jgi:hypothetical protein